MPKACLQCRNRKVKCHRISADGPCVNCSRLDFTCTAIESINSDSLQQLKLIPSQIHHQNGYTLAGTARKRVTRACVACHSQKARCSADRPSCRRCFIRGFKCEYTPSRRKIVTAAVVSTPSESTVSDRESSASLVQDPASHDESMSTTMFFRTEQRSSNLPSPKGQVAHGHECEQMAKLCRSLFGANTDLERFVNAYFDYVYPIPIFSFLQRALFMRDFKQGKYVEALVLAVCASGSIFLAKSEDDRRIRDIWIEQAESYVLKRIDEPSLVNIQIILLITYVYSALRKPRKVLSLLSIASRMAYVSRLNYEREDMPFMPREIRRRVMWALCMMDSLYSAGLPEFTTCSMQNNHLKLPCGEVAFAMDAEEESEPLNPQDSSSFQTIEPGILAYYIRVLDFRYRILRYTKDAALQDQLPSNYQDEVATFVRGLEQLKLTLPRSLELSERTLTLHAYSSMRRTLIMWHVWWQQCFLDLYRPLFPTLKEGLKPRVLQSLPQEYISTGQQVCFKHAVSLTQIFRLVNRLNSSEQYVVTDHTLAICAYQCTRILSQGHRIPTVDTEITKHDILENVKLCHDVLTPLREIYAVVRVIQEEIYAMLHKHRYFSTGSVTPEIQDNQQTATGASGTWLAINQDRVLSKHGSLEHIYKEEWKEEMGWTPQEQTPKFSNKPTNSSLILDVDQRSSAFSEQPPTLSLDRFQHSTVTPDDKFWTDDWDVHFDDVNFDLGIDPFF